MLHPSIIYQVVKDRCVIGGAHACAAQIHKYALEIQIHPKYSLYLNWTIFSNDDNFGPRSSISLSKVKFGIYWLMLIILRGRKYTNTLWKYKYTPNTVCIWIGLFFQMMITLDHDLRFHFPRWNLESTDWCWSSCEVANTQIRFGNTNTPQIQFVFELDYFFKWW